MTERILQGPFLTRAQAAHQARVPARLLADRPDLLRLGSDWLREVYFAFQFDTDGVVPEIGAVVHELKGQYSDVDIGDWLVRPHPALNSSTPLRFLKSGGEVRRVVAAANQPGKATAQERSDPLLGKESPRHPPRTRCHPPLSAGSSGPPGRGNNRPDDGRNESRPGSREPAHW